MWHWLYFLSTTPLILLIRSSSASLVAMFADVYVRGNECEEKNWGNWVENELLLSRIHATHTHTLFLIQLCDLRGLQELSVLVVVAAVRQNRPGWVESAKRQCKR